MQRSSSGQSQEAEISVQLSKLKEDLEYVRNFVIRICKFLFPEDWAETGTQDAEFSKEGAGTGTKDAWADCPEVKGEEK
ncbi:hypothetical protein U1Q18_015051 [Sarracenia purpurea var. burkii]